MAVHSTPLVMFDDTQVADRLHQEYLIAGPSHDMIELTNVSFAVKRGWLLREPNQDYIERELAWYKSQSRNVNDIPGGTPVIWKHCADHFGNINSNYGWCTDSVDNGYQYDAVAQELADNPDSRRAVMYYTRPTMHVDQNLNGMNDHMCTFAVQYTIRNDKLDAMVYMRSNDAVFGYNNDVAWQQHVHTHLLDDLRTAHDWLELGELFWNVGSLHVYPRHYFLLEPAR